MSCDACVISANVGNERVIVEVRLSAMKVIGTMAGGACVLYRCDACDALWENCMGERRATEVSREYARKTYPDAGL